MIVGSQNIVIILFFLQAGHAGAVSQRLSLVTPPPPPEVDDQPRDGGQEDENEEKYQPSQVPLLQPLLLGGGRAPRCRPFHRVLDDKRTWRAWPALPE